MTALPTSPRRNGRARPRAALVVTIDGNSGWIGNGNFWSTDMVDYLVSWLNCARQNGLTIDYLGGWNERGHDKTWYENLKRALVGNGYGAVKVVADDTDWGTANDVVSDPAFAAAVDVIGAHYPCGYRSAQTSCPSTSNGLASGKPLWASENGSDDDNLGAPALARGINRGYLDGKMTAYLNWPVLAAITPNLPYPTMGVAVSPQPWSGSYTIGRNAWVMAQTTQFTAPGWRYLGSGGGYLGGNRSNGSYVTLKSTDGTDYSTVVETVDAAVGQSFTATVTGGLGPSFAGTTIAAVIDGTTVRTVTDGSWPTGQVGYGTSQGQTAQFDNLSVTPLAGPPPPQSSRLVGAGSNRCLDVPNASQANGTQLEIWDCNGGSNQAWTRS